jgi:predicted site-specific integrase-resolvase
MERRKELINNKNAMEMLHISRTTLHRWADLGYIECIKMPNGYRLYNIKKYMEENKMIENTENKKNCRKKICYCRVSTPGQKDDLVRQIK